MVECIFTVGLAASGKSSWANAQEGYLVLDSDLLRKELWGSETDQQNPTKVFDVMYKRAADALSRGQSTICCSTNLNMRYRIHALNQLKHKCPNVKYRCVIFNTPVEICREWNQQRERHVPNWLFDKQMRAFQCPVENEGWDSIEIVTPKKYNKVEFCNRMWDDVRAVGSQDNPHHTLTLYEHLLACIKKIHLATLKSETDEMQVLTAAGLHDIGKAYTRTYDDKEVAHYYNHENFSSYLAMNMGMPLEVMQLVNYHMIPCNAAACPNWEKRLGAELWNKIIVLHKADMEAK